MDRNELIEKIIKKKEFSQLPKKDIELAFEKFDKTQNTDYQKLKSTRQFLRKVYSSFSSRKLLGIKERDIEWVLKNTNQLKKDGLIMEKFMEEFLNSLKRRDFSN